MSRSPLAYPLVRSADTDVGGAADLQTDVMRFMAILALCLVAIFALVQSIPLTPTAPPDPGASVPADPPTVAPADPLPVVDSEPVAAPERVVLTRPGTALTRPERPPDITLTRPQRVPRPEPLPRSTDPAAAEAEPVPDPPAAPPAPEAEGFTLRFASDAALMRAVAAHHVGVYAIEPGRARRMTVSESRISFWDASTPNTYHEMETDTVPLAVVDALSRTGVEPAAVRWGVTLPGKMTTELESLMQAHRGGALIIGSSGQVHWEGSQ